jgi:hypothetical protein
MSKWKADLDTFFNQRDKNAHRAKEEEHTREGAVIKAWQSVETVVASAVRELKDHLEEKHPGDFYVTAVDSGSHCVLTIKDSHQTTIRINVSLTKDLSNIEINTGGGPSPGYAPLSAAKDQILECVVQCYIKAQPRI